MAPHITQAFSSLTVHGIVSTRDGEPRPIVLKRCISFPQPFYKGFRPPKETNPPPDDISPAPILGYLDLEARVKYDLEGDSSSYSDACALGRGRAGHVFPLEVLNIREANSIPDLSGNKLEIHDIALCDLPPLCVKIGKPTCSRYLAREAWFYERFERAKLVGILAPRCFGVFSAPLSPTNSDEALTVSIPGYDYDEEAEEALEEYDAWSAPLPEQNSVRVYDEETLEPLPQPDLGIHHLDDPAGSFSGSPWATFRERRDDPVITVLVLERLGI